MVHCCGVNQGKLKCPPDISGPQAEGPASGALCAHRETLPRDPNNTQPLRWPAQISLALLLPVHGSDGLSSASPGQADVTRSDKVAHPQDGDPGGSPPATSALPGCSRSQGEPGRPLSPYPVPACPRKGCLDPRVGTHST